LVEAWAALFAAPLPSTHKEPAEPSDQQAADRNDQSEGDGRRAELADEQPEQPDSDDVSDEPFNELSEARKPTAAEAEPAEPDAEQSESAEEPAESDSSRAEQEEDTQASTTEDDHAEQMEEKYVEVCILQLNIAMLESANRCADIDSRLRACQGRTESETIEQCVELLKQDCREYLAAQGRASEQLRERVDELGELSSIAEQIEMANLEQAAQIETTLSNLDHMDFSSDLEAANERLRIELGKLREARHHLRDNQELAFLAVARHHQRLDQIERRLHRDPLTDLLNRIGLEVVLEEWWEEGRQRSRSMTAAVLDINGFAELNKQHGPAVGDRVLAGLGRLLRSASAGMEMRGRFSGQQFLLIKLDEGARAAIRRMESVRQSIERSSFRADGEEITLTVSAGYAAVLPDDTVQDVFDRLAAALKEAKQQGDNQAFYHDGQRSEQTKSPYLVAQPVEATV